MCQKLACNSTVDFVMVVNATSIQSTLEEKIILCIFDRNSNTYVTVYGKTGHNAACVISRKDRSIS